MNCTNCLNKDKTGCSLIHGVITTGGEYKFVCEDNCKALSDPPKEVNND